MIIQENYISYYDDDDGLVLEPDSHIVFISDFNLDFSLVDTRNIF